MIQLHVILICEDVKKCTENSLSEIIWCATLTIYRQELQIRLKSFQTPASTCSKLLVWYITQVVATPNETSSVCLNGKNCEHQSKPNSKISHKLPSTLMCCQLL